MGRVEAIRDRVVVFVPVESPVVRSGARAAAREGAAVVVVFSSDVNAAQDMINELRSAGGSATMLAGDPTIAESNWAMVEKVVEQLGAIDAVVVDVSALRSSRYRPGVRGEWTPMAPTEAALDLVTRAGQGDASDGPRQLIWLSTEKDVDLLSAVVRALDKAPEGAAASWQVRHSVVREDHGGFTVGADRGNGIDFPQWLISTLTSDMTSLDESSASADGGSKDDR